MAKIPQPSYPLKVFSEYNDLNNVEKNIFNAFVEAHLEMFRDLHMYDYFLNLIQKSALKFVYNLPEELREIESILLSIYRRLDLNEKQFIDRVTTVDEELRNLKNKYTNLHNKFDNSISSLELKIDKIDDKIMRNV